MPRSPIELSTVWTAWNKRYASFRESGHHIIREEQELTENAFWSRITWALCPNLSETEWLSQLLPSPYIRGMAITFHCHHKERLYEKTILKSILFLDVYSLEYKLNTYVPKTVQMYFKTPVQMTQIVFGGGRYSNISNIWEILETQIVRDIRRSTSRRHK